MKAIIIAIGDEILVGNTINSNASHISFELTNLGIDIIKHVVIEDSFEIIKKEFDFAIKNFDVIISTGGLGPTRDDLTKNAIIDLLSLDLEKNIEQETRILDYFKKRNRQAKETHIEQAFLPKNSTALNNHTGTAPGFYLRTQYESHLFVMPGVPREMTTMLEKEVKPLISEIKKDYSDNFNSYKLIQTHGIFESDLADKLEFLYSKYPSLKLAFLPSYSGVRLRIGVNNSDTKDVNKFLNEVDMDIKKTLPNYYLENGNDLVFAVANLLLRKNLTLSCAESCTGGLLSGKLTDISGSSKFLKGSFVTYSNDAKIEQINVSRLTLEKFGAVSQEVAIEMAKGCLNKLKTDYSLSITGIAGPDGGSAEKPVGTVWIGLANNSKVIAKKFIFTNDRFANRQLSIYNALSILYTELKS